MSSQKSFLVSGLFPLRDVAFRQKREVMASLIVRYGHMQGKKTIINHHKMNPEDPLKDFQILEATPALS